MNTPSTTRISVSTPAGDDLLAGFLRRARLRARADGWVLRGGVLMAALFARARRPADVDFALLGAFDADVLGHAIREVVALPDAGTALTVDELVGIWLETPFPGLRAILSGRSTQGDARMQVDFGFGDPQAVAPCEVHVAGVGPVLACAPETLFGWKLHGLVEFGRGAWRAKDLFDLQLLATLPLEPAPLRAAVELSFSSRDLPLSALDDFLTRAEWGLSRSGQRKWRTFAKRTAHAPDFLEARERVKASVAALLGRSGVVCHTGAMDRDFWLERWHTGQIGFHLGEANPRLVEHAAVLDAGGPKRVLVPLCGKSLDLAYLASRGHEVVGIELAEEAGRAFFAERGVAAEVQKEGPFLRLSGAGITVLVGDFFAAEAAALGVFDAAYDRASMIALPPDLRARYVPKLVSLLAPTAAILLVTLDFDAGGGPPFSIAAGEVKERYAAHDVRELAAVDVTSDSPNLLARGATRVLERVFQVRTRG